MNHIHGFPYGLSRTYLTAGVCSMDSMGSAKILGPAQGLQRKHVDGEGVVCLVWRAPE